MGDIRATGHTWPRVHGIPTGKYHNTPRAHTPLSRETEVDRLQKGIALGLSIEPKKKQNHIKIHLQKKNEVDCRFAALQTHN